MQIHIYDMAHFWDTHHETVNKLDNKSVTIYYINYYIHKPNIIIMIRLQLYHTLIYFF